MLQQMWLPNGQPIQVMNFNLVAPKVAPRMADPRAMFTRNHVLQPCQWTRLPNGQVVSLANSEYFDGNPTVTMGTRGNIYAFNMQASHLRHGVQPQLKARI